MKPGEWAERLNSERFGRRWTKDWVRTSRGKSDETSLTWTVVSEARHQTRQGFLNAGRW